MARKKGEVSITFLVTLSLAIIVLIVIGLFFMGKTEWLIGKGEEASTTALSEGTKSIAIEKCKLFCSLRNREGYNSPGFSKEVLDAGFTRCYDFDELGEYEDECMRCVGTPKLAAPTSCGGSDEKSCEAVSGCTWEPAPANKCSGTPTATAPKACEGYPRAECGVDTGCRWE